MHKLAYEAADATSHNSGHKIISFHADILSRPAMHCARGNREGLTLCGPTQELPAPIRQFAHEDTAQKNLSGQTAVEMRISSDVLKYIASGNH
jgi:hypothetical protein